jgi:hypothetical protein
MKKAIEVVANIAIIVVCVFICCIFIFRAGGLQTSGYLTGSSEPRLVGKTLWPFPTYQWANHPKTMILALRVGCHFCEANIPFYRTLSELQEQDKLNAHLLVVMPDDRLTATKMLESSGLQLDGLYGESLHALNVSGTPTLMLLDNNGRIQRAWVGQLDTDSENQVFRVLEK